MPLLRQDQGAAEVKSIIRGGGSLSNRGLHSAPPDERERSAIDDYDRKRDQFEDENDVIIRHRRTVAGP